MQTDQVIKTLTKMRNAEKATGHRMNGLSPDNAIAQMCFERRDALTQAINLISEYVLATSSDKNRIEIRSVKGWIINFHSPEDGWCAFRTRDGGYVGDPQRFYPLSELLTMIEAIGENNAKK